MLHSYVLYPIILSVMKSRKLEVGSWKEEKYELPNVKIVLAVFNEEKVIEKKLESIFNTTYPKEKISVHIGSDTSNDETENIIRAFQKLNSAVHLTRFETRTGKPQIINQLINEIKIPHPHPFSEGEGGSGEIFLLTDANVFFSPTMLTEMMKHFQEKEIAVVGANVQNVLQSDKQIAEQEKFYIQRENHIKHSEGNVFGTMMGAFGGCYAIRANYFHAVPPNFIADDFYICMKAMEQNGKAIMELDAVCYEDLNDSMSVEFKRKSRISTGNFQNLAAFKHILLKPFSPLGFCFLSHKVIRWFGPFFILLIYFSNLFLAYGNKFYWFVFLLQNVLLLFVLLDEALLQAGKQSKVLRLISYFYLMNFALLVGFFIWVKGVKTNVWSPTQRK